MAAPTARIEHAVPQGFSKYDAGHELPMQAQAEAPIQEFEIRRLSASPFALPLVAERLRAELTTEKLKDHLDRMLEHVEHAADAAAAGASASASATRGWRHRPIKASR